MRALSIGGSIAWSAIGLRLEDLHFRAEVFLHDLAYVIARLLQHLQPAVFPVANPREPGRAAAARKRLGAASLEMHAAVPVEALALPDLRNRDIVRIRK